MIWAIIENGLVVNTILADNDFVQNNYPEAIRIDEMVPMPSKGWSYTDGEFKPSFTSVTIIPEESLIES